MKKFNKPRNPIKFVLIFVLILSVIAFVVGGFAIGQKEKSSNQFCTQEAKKCPDGSWVSRTGPKCEFAPCPAPTINLKSYKNTKYGFELSYPAKGIIQNGTDFSEGECGNVIKETGNNILVDNLFKIQVVDWTKTIDDYLVGKGAKKIYEIKPIIGSNADEAIEIAGIKKGLEVTSVGYPPLMNIPYIYKKGDNLFQIIYFLHASNGGCINPKDLDHTKFPKFADQNWNVKDSFKFIF